MILKTPRMMLIDLDGTLVDSVPDLAYCVDETLRALGMPVRGEARVRQWVGNGVERLLHRGLINQLDGEADAALYERAYPIFMALYKANTSVRSQVYDGVREGLAWMKGAGFRVGCVTNKPGAFTEPLLKDLGLYDHFEIVISGDSLPRKKPDPLPLLHAAQHFGVTPAESLMIGDSISDVKAARAAGFQIVCMSYGYNHGNDIREAAPDAVIDSMMELPALFTAMPT